MNELNILLVDDDGVDVQTVQRALRRRGIANPVHVARDGIEALDLLLGREGCAPLDAPRLILLDLNMPRMDGFEFLAELRQHAEHDDDPIFVLTTSDDDRHRAEAHGLGVSGFIVKDELSLRALDLVIQGLQTMPPAEVASVDVGRMVRGLMNQLDPDDRFELVLPPSVLLLETAGARLELVLRNLLENAVQHHDQEHGRVGVTWEEYDDLVRFRVQDDGPGISPDRAREIFRPLHTTKPPGDGPLRLGQGMGLPVASHIVGAAGGTMAALGSIGRGATLSFTWPIEWITPAEVSLLSMAPLEEEDEPTAERQPASPPEIDAALGGATAGEAELGWEIVLVDDDEVDRTSMRRALERRGHVAHLHEAADADQALALLTGSDDQGAVSPALVLVDLALAGRSGIELLDAIRADPKLCGTPVFVLSSSQDPADQQRAALRHVAGFIDKQRVAPYFTAVVDLLEAYDRAVRPIEHRTET